MKLRFVFALLVLFCTTSLFAQGYKDGVEYYKVNQFEKAKILLNRNLNNADTDKALAYYYLGQVAMARSEEHTSELQSHLQISYAVFCLKKKTFLMIRRPPRSTLFPSRRSSDLVCVPKCAAGFCMTPQRKRL